MKKIFCLFILGLLLSGCGEFKSGMSKARIEANEEVAQHLCKVYADTIEAYRRSNQRYPTSFQELNEGGYLSPSDPYNRLILQSKPAQGYYYKYYYIDENHFILEVKPAEKDVTGGRTFKVNENGVVNIY
jgi:type II secretory pathway pseudopilin PulG